MISSTESVAMSSLSYWRTVYLIRCCRFAWYYARKSMCFVLLWIQSIQGRHECRRIDDHEGQSQFRVCHEFCRCGMLLGERAWLRLHSLYSEDDTVSNSHITGMNWVPRIQAALTEDRFVLYCQTVQSTGRGYNRGPRTCTTRSLCGWLITAAESFLLEASSRSLSVTTSWESTTAG